jgi:hypothetical protein
MTELWYTRRPKCTALHLVNLTAFLLGPHTARMMATWSPRRRRPMPSATVGADATRTSYASPLPRSRASYRYENRHRRQRLRNRQESQALPLARRPDPALTDHPHSTRGSNTPEPLEYQGVWRCCRCDVLSLCSQPPRRRIGHQETTEGLVVQGKLSRVGFEPTTLCLKGTCSAT